MPTRSLPGIGASMRIERAARAIARSSLSASMRDSLTPLSGRTSYCVTTGPEFWPTTLAGIAKWRSFSSMRRMLASWSTPALPVDGRAGSSSSIDGRIQSIEARPSAGSSSASTDDGRVATATAPAAGSGAAPSPVQTVRLTGAELIAGAGGASRMLGTAGSPDPGLIGTATAALAAAGFAAGLVSVARRSLERVGGGRLRPCAGPHERPHDLVQVQVEGEHQPDHDHRQQHHDGAGRRQERLEQALEEPADASARRERGAPDAGPGRSRGPRRRAGRCPAGSAPSPSAGAIRGSRPRRAAGTGAASAWPRTTGRRRRSTSW